MKSFLKRKRKSKNQAVADTPSRITNETVAEHRERVLAGGRKFKYPVQYQKHKLVINTILIAIGAVLLAILVSWQQLYLSQNSSKLVYRITQLIPLSVASVDGEPVRYSDYLMRYRSSIFYLQKYNAINLNSKDGKRQSEFIKRQELNSAEKMAYATKLARGKRITVINSEIDEIIKDHASSEMVSLDGYERTVLLDLYDWSLDEYRHIVRGQILKRKVSFAVDESARQKATQLLKSVAEGADIATVARDSSDDLATKSKNGDSGQLQLDDEDPNGLNSVASQLEVNQLSGLIEGTDGYYFIKLISKDQSTVRFHLVKVKLSVFDDQFAQLQKNGKIKEYISVEKNQQTQDRTKTP